MPVENQLIINEAQLILAEKRTHLASLRTGIAVMALPMGFVSFLIVSSQFYQVKAVLWLLVPLLVACTGLGFLGVYMVLKAVLKLRRDEQLMQALKARHSFLCEFVD